MKALIRKRHRQGKVGKLAALLMALAVVSLAPGCGDGSATVLTSTGAERQGAAVATTQSQTKTTATQPVPPAYPNLDEAEANNIQSVAVAAYSRSWADGSGVSVIWGPNIVSDWALLGLENVSGTAGKDVLLHKEAGGWAVKDVGQALGNTWGSQTPLELWPQT